MRRGSSAQCCATPRRGCAAGCDTSRLDAEVLLGAVLGVGLASRGGDARPGRAVDAAASRGSRELVARRAAREPVAYITGCKRVPADLVWRSTRRVLIPRPETELLVEVGLRPAARSAGGGRRHRERGGGAGREDERPDLDVSGIDVEQARWRWRRGNGATGAGGLLRARRICCDGGDRRDRGPDAVLANLPYVGAGAPLPPEIA